MKIDRHKVYEKTGGKCAYCGCAIDYKKMHVDHYWPKHIAHLDPLGHSDRIENLMPSCIKCNLHKGGMMLETWRKELSRQIEILKKDARFDRVLRYGLIEINKTPIVFYFETL